MKRVAMGLSIVMIGCAKDPIPSTNPASTASTASAAPTPAAVGTEAAAPVAHSDSKFCEEMRERVQALASAAKKCKPGDAKACQTCIRGPIFHCGFFAGNDKSKEATTYLAALDDLVAKGCVQPVTVTPPCTNNLHGKCGPDGTCGFEHCTPP